MLGWVALSAVLALFQGAWVWLCWRVYPQQDKLGGMPSMREQFLTNRWTHQLGWTLSCAALWVTMEMIQTRICGGFPWNYLGVSQFRMVPLIQMTSFTGVYGLSFLMVWFSITLISAGAVIIMRPAQPRDWMLEVFPPFFILVLVVGFGLRKVYYAGTPPQSIKAALVQPSIPQQVIWDAGKGEERFQSLVALSRDALTNDVDVLIWPEAAVPNLFRYDTNIHMVVTNMVQDHKVWMIMGADDVTRRSATEFDYYNSSMLLSPEGRLLSIYRKRKLVMFGEYLPLADWLPFMRDFTTVTGDFTPGQQPVPFLLGDLNIKLSVLICFEDVFPHLVRQDVDRDTDFLVNLTNNGWFGESAAQWQHAASAVFRAVENGLPLVRCSNNGLTCWVDSLGRIRDEYFENSDNIYQAGFKVVEVPILGGELRALTFYTRFGDVFGWGCVLWSALLSLWRVMKWGGRGGMA
jgi:apolipoprotein N-acyltransferase